MTLLDRLVEAIASWCDGHGILSVADQDRDWTAMLSYYRRHVRVYLNNADGGCTQFPFDLDQPRDKWRGPLLSMIEWAENAEDNDAA